MRPGPKPGRRYPIEPLEAAIPPADCDRTHDAESRQGRVSALRVAALLGVDRTLIHRWRREGLTVAAADRAALAVGCHPVELWPDFHDDVGMS